MALTHPEAAKADASRPQGDAPKEDAARLEEGAAPPARGRRRTSLGGRLVLATLGFCLVFTVAAVALRTWSAWQSSVSAMSEELRLIGQVYAHTLSKSAWDMDRDALHAHVASMAGVPSVGQVTLTIQMEGRAPEVVQRTSSGWMPSSKAPSLRVPLGYEPFPGAHENLGHLVLAGDERVLWARLRSEVAAIIGTQLIQSALLASLIMLMFSRLVTVHVQRIARHLSQITPDTLGRVLALERSPNRQDELTLLVAGVNELQGKLADRLAQQQIYENELATHRDHLADLVRDRTAELEAANVRLESANALLDGLARTDPLTGLANRRHFDELKEIELRRAVRSKLPLSLIVCDIDDFKRYNDAYGHAAGDHCLRSVAAALRSNFGRAGDLVARIGGEEFAVLLPATPETHAVDLAEQLRRTMETLHIPHEGSRAAPHVSLSMGIAELAPLAPGGFDALFAEADKALYRAKASGRNRAAASGTPNAP